MSTSGVAALDQAVQDTNVWLKAVAEQLHFEDRHHAYIALRAVLHALRDRLPPEVAVHLGGPASDADPRRLLRRLAYGRKAGERS